MIKIEDKLHPSHEVRSSDASSFDFICENCGATDGLGTWGRLILPCPAVTITASDFENK